MDASVMSDLWAATEVLELRGYLLSVLIMWLLLSYVFFFFTVKLYDENGETSNTKILNSFIYGAISPVVVVGLFGLLIWLAIQSQNWAVVMIMALIALPCMIVAPIVVYVHIMQCSFSRGVLFLFVPQGLMGSFGFLVSIFLPWMVLVSDEQEMAIKSFLGELTSGSGADLATRNLEDPFERLHRLVNRDEVSKLALEGDFYKMNATEVNTVERFIESEAAELRENRSYRGLMTPEERERYNQRLSNLRKVTEKYKQAYASSTPAPEQE